MHVSSMTVYHNCFLLIEKTLVLALVHMNKKVRKKTFCSSLLWKTHHFSELGPKKFQPSLPPFCSASGSESCWGAKREEDTSVTRSQVGSGRIWYNEALKKK